MSDSSSENTHDVTIMVVDDQPDIRKLIEFHLKKIGYTQIIAAENGRQALDATARNIPDLVLMDIMMPVMDGLKTCAAFKKDPRLAEVPIIIVSALDDIRNKAAAYGVGADDFLAKPLDTITLAARCRAVIQTRKLKDQIRHMTDSRSISETLFNYQHLYERLLTHLEHCRRRGLPFSMIYADIDYMKMLNTTYNAHTGDKVIQQVRQLFYDKVENLGAVITSNSDKLLVLLPGVNEGRVLVLADDILNQVRQISLPVEFERELDLKSLPGDPSVITKVSLSMGIVTWEKAGGVLADKLMEAVEKALREAKAEGRGRKVQFQFFSHPEGSGTNKIDKTVIRDYKRKDDT
jgi:diguanylate cyclase (GGDEF)-like protein